MPSSEFASAPFGSQAECSSYVISAHCLAVAPAIRMPTFGVCAFATHRWTKQLEDKGGLRSVVRETAGAVGDSAGAIGAQVQGSLKGLVTMRSYKLHIPPGEILLADATIEVVSKDGTMASLLQAIRERLGALHWLHCIFTLHNAAAYSTTGVSVSVSP